MAPAGGAGGGLAVAVLLMVGLCGGGYGQEQVMKKYMVVWTDTLAVTRETSYDIDSVQCNDNSTCQDALLNYNVSLNYDSDIPSSPYCITPENKTNVMEGNMTGHCTCGQDRCVSYSRESNGDPFYYCGPCGYVGSQCYNNSCTHDLAECRGGYCECVMDGIFYNLAYCYIPYFGRRMAINMVITTTVIVAFCAILAFVYHKLTYHRHRSYEERWNRGSFRREAPSNDTPPNYDDVVEKLPSYQDALEMVGAEGSADGGIANPVFIPDQQSSPPEYEEIERTTDTACQDSSQAPTTPTSTPTPVSFSTPKDKTSSTPTLTENVKEQGATASVQSQQGKGTSNAVDLSKDQPTTAISQPQPIETPLQSAMINLKETTETQL